MALFLSTYINRVDRKGRVSVPAAFRTALNAQAFQGIVVFRSPVHACLEGFDGAKMDDLATRLDQFDLFSAEQDDLATAIFGDATPMAFDGDGRVTLTPELIAHANIAEQVAFVGLGRKFQLWEPSALKARQVHARANARDKGLTLPSIIGGAAS
jgi:MraZ protein